MVLLGGCPSPSACGGIFRDSQGYFLGAFAGFIGVDIAFQAELQAVMTAIELAFRRRWLNLWLETDSTFVVAAFSNHNLVPWDIRNRWSNCLWLLRQFKFYVTHIFREGNSCADSLANYAL